MMLFYLPHLFVLALIVTITCGGCASTQGYRKIANTDYESSTGDSLTSGVDAFLVYKTSKDIYEDGSTAIMLRDFSGNSYVSLCGVGADKHRQLIVFAEFSGFHFPGETGSEQFSNCLKMSDAFDNTSKEKPARLIIGEGNVIQSVQLSNE